MFAAACVKRRHANTKTKTSEKKKKTQEREDPVVMI